MTTKYLIVEDHDDLRSQLANELQRSTSATGVLVAASGEEALETLEQETDVDMVVLDLSLHTEMYGMEVLRRIREFSNVPVAILTTDPAPERQTEAIELGANAYMYKGVFDSPIQMRRHLEAVQKVSRLDHRHILTSYYFDGWTLDVARRRLFNPDGAEITLSHREFELLLAFVENPGIVLAQKELIEKVGMDSNKNPSAAFTKLIFRLRRKIDKDHAEPFIVNVYAQGFRFTPRVVSADSA